MQELLEKQQKELARLINKGFPFELTVTKKIRKPGLLGFFQKKITVTETRKFSVKEPTLYTLDRIAIEAMEIDKDGLKSSELKKYTLEKRYYNKIARIAAIAVADHEDDEPELEEILFKTLKPSDLRGILDLADIAGNLMDFISSILSVTAVRKNTERIEKKELPDLNHHTDSEE